MVFSTLILTKDKPIYIQLKEHIIKGIQNNTIHKNDKLPSTREASKFLGISRNSVISAYELLEDEGIICTKKGVGSFVILEGTSETPKISLSYDNLINSYGKSLRNLDIIKTEKPSPRNVISFKSIAPSPELFNMDDFKRALLDACSFEETNLLNYGYAKGYKPLIDFFISYMEDKNADMKNKDILITNGFTEAFDIILSVLTVPGDTIVCEEPTHNTAIKIMKAYGLNVIQIPMDTDGIKTDKLEKVLNKNKIKLGYLIPSYNNPTGIVTKTERRKKIHEIFMKHNIPIIEDGFNEELLYSSSPVPSMFSLAGQGNGIIYIGSLSKILFPGLRIGWIAADEQLIDVFESVKRGKTIHSSFLDQSALFYYMQNGAFNRYLKNVRKYYRNKFTILKDCIEKYIPYEYITGEGGLHIFLKLKNNINARKLLDLCLEDGVNFTPGDIFYASDNKDAPYTLRLGFGRVKEEDIEKGIKIISENIKKLSNY